MLPLAARIYVTTKCGLNCPECPNGGPKRSPRIDAKFEDILRYVVECYQLGIRCIEWAGGDPTLWPKIVESMALCKELGIFTLLPVSGPGLVDSFKRLGTDWLALPDIIRISTHVYPRLGIDTLGKVREALKVIKRIRSAGETQLGVILIPGEKGNLKDEFLAPVRSLAEEFFCSLHLSPVLGAWKAGNWDKIMSLWRNVSKKNSKVIDQFFQLPSVLPHSVEKVLFRLHGGNIPKTTVCQAGKTVITLKDGKVGPCDFISHYAESVRESISKALGSKDMQSCIEMSGTFGPCEGCTAGCNDVMNTLSGHSTLAELQRAYCEM